MASSELLDLFTKGLHELLPPKDFSILGVEKNPDLLGKQYLNAILQEAENLYGISSSKGLFFRCGEASFKYLVRKYGDSVEINGLEFRLQPQQKRLLDGTKKLIRALEKWQMAKFAIRQSADLVEITLSPADVSNSSTGNQIWLHFAAGIFHEFLSWAGNGKHYPFQIFEVESPSDGIVIQFQMLPVD